MSSATTITVVKGVLNSSVTLAVIERSENGGYADAAGQFDDAPDLACTLWPGDGMPVAASLTATWADAESALIAIEFTPQSAIDALDAGWYQGQVKTVETGELIAEFVLAVEDGPGDREARPVYCTYRDLMDELPWLDQMADETRDDTGFSAIRAEARSWTDAKIIDHAQRCGRYTWTPTYGRDAYTAALADDALILDTPNGRRIVKANVYYAVSQILVRGLKTTADFVALSESYMAKAEATLNQCRAEFPDDSPPPIVIGAVITARVVR